ncbi:hypothetical protein [Caballeronia sp. RCC_10]|uniref:hypothetical protein n=1 Tax=Caballeronia sp. RCC_10 TaxID=3239227 RepID=UPI003523E999
MATNSATQSWNIHKRILRPSLGNVDRLGFDPTPEGVGTEGGVVLIEFEDKEDQLRVRYRYTDVFVLLAFECSVIERDDGRSRTVVTNCLDSLMQRLGNERVAVPQAAFVSARDVDSLLSLLGLHSNADSGWKWITFSVRNRAIIRTLPTDGA